MHNVPVSLASRSVELPFLLDPCDDPWQLEPAERRELAAAMQAEQMAWLPRLEVLVEPPAPRGDFPAFLLETPPFSGLSQRIGESQAVSDLDIATADELQRFVDRYRDYLS